MKLTTILRNNNDLRQSMMVYRICPNCGKGHWTVWHGNLYKRKGYCKECHAKAWYTPDIIEKRNQTRRESCKEPKLGYWTRTVNGKQVLEHRLIMEKYLGRPLTSEEVVHHIDGDKTNNDISNLMLFPNNSEHIKYHQILKNKGE